MSLRTVFIKIGRAVLQKHTNFSPLCIYTQKTCYSNKPFQPLVVEGISEEELQKKKRKVPIIPRITLLSGNDDISVTTLEEAQKLAKRRDLKLVKILDLDTKTQRPVYKLMTPTEYHAEDVKNKKQNKDTGFKGEKVVMMTTAISDHDLQIHIKKIEKWIAKNFEVRIAISGNSSSSERGEEIYKIVEDNLKDSARLVQKRSKGNDFKFQVIPPKKDKNKDNGGNL